MKGNNPTKVTKDIEVTTQKDIGLGTRKTRWDLDAPYIANPACNASNTHIRISKGHPLPKKTGSQVHDFNLVDEEYIARWKDNFNNLNIPKKDYFSLLIRWAQKVGCTHDHKLISNCLDFIDSKAQVHVSGLSPNLYHYLPSLYHFLVKLLKERASLEALESDRNMDLFIPLGSG